MPAGEFLDMMSSPKFLGDPLIRTHHLMGRKTSSCSLSSKIRCTLDEAYGLVRATASPSSSTLPRFLSSTILLDDLHSTLRLGYILEGLVTGVLRQSLLNRPPFMAAHGCVSRLLAQFLELSLARIPLTTLASPAGP
jgi:hypothetical protein